MGLRLGGGLGPFRAGVSNRGVDAGIGPLSVGGRWPRAPRRKSSRKNGSDLSGLGGGGGVIAFVALLALLWPLLLGMWIAAKFGASDDTQVNVGLVFEAVYVALVIFYFVERHWSKRTERKRQEKLLALQEAEERVGHLQKSLGQAQLLRTRIAEKPTGSLVNDDPVIRRGEFQLCELSDIWLVEQRSAYRGGPQIMKRTTHGSVLFTDAGIRFKAPNKTIKWKFENLIKVEQSAEYLVLKVSNRQKPSGIASDSQAVLDLAFTWAKSASSGTLPKDILSSLDSYITSTESALVEALLEVEVATTETPRTTATPTTPRPPAGTNTEPPLKTITSGTYVIGVDFDPGTYRVAGYFALLNESLDIVENDGEYGFGTTLVNVPEPGGESVYLEISGEAILAADSPVSVNAGIAELESGTYVVGTDIAPGRYRVRDADYAYAARLRSMPNGEWDIISNAGNEGSVIIIIEETDDAFEFSGTLEEL